MARTSYSKTNKAKKAALKRTFSQSSEDELSLPGSSPPSDHCTSSATTTITATATATATTADTEPTCEDNLPAAEEKENATPHLSANVMDEFEAVEAALASGDFALDEDFITEEHDLPSASASTSALASSSPPPSGGFSAGAARPAPTTFPLSTRGSSGGSSSSDGQSTSSGGTAASAPAAVNSDPVLSRLDALAAAGERMRRKFEQQERRITALHKRIARLEGSR